jgi:hypothetical protein
MPDDEFRVFGNVRSPSGAIMACSGRGGITQMYAFVAREHLKIAGTVITPDVEKMIQAFAETKVKDLFAEIEAQGVADYLAQLFVLGKKREAEKHLRKLTIYKEDFIALIHNSDSIGFSHSLVRKQFVPDYLHITKSDLDAVRKSAHGNLSPEAWATLRKVRTTFDERKVNHCHLFERGSEWHAFIFSYEDITRGDRQHWEHGPHLHYLSHLWRTVTKEQFLTSFEGRRGADWGRVHVKYSEEDRE